MNRPSWRMIICSLACSRLASAGGFEGPGLGARAESMGGAFIAVADDWTAIYWNPAGLSQLHGAGVGVSVDTVRVRSHDSTGLANPNLPVTNQNLLRGDVFFQTGGEPSQFSGEDSSFWTPLPGIGAYASKWGFTFAAGSYAPLGFSYNVSDNSQPNFAASYESEGYILNHNFSMAREVIPGVRIGAGVNLIQARLERTALKITPDYNYSASSNGEGWDVQGVFGFLVDMCPHVRAGGVYRTGQNIPLSGHASIEDSQLPPESSDYTQSLRNPTTYGIGLAWEPISKVTLSADWQRTQWAPSRLDVAFEQQGLILQNENLSLGSSNTSRYRFGTEWRPSTEWSFRAGYFRDPGAVSDPAEALTNVVAVDQRFFTCGLSFTQPHWRLNLGSQYSSGHEDIGGRTLKRDNLSALVGIDYFI